MVVFAIRIRRRYCRPKWLAILSWIEFHFVHGLVVLHECLIVPLQWGGKLATLTRMLILSALAYASSSGRTLI